MYHLPQILLGVFIVLAVVLAFVLLRGGRRARPTGGAPKKTGGGGAPAAPVEIDFDAPKAVDRAGPDMAAVRDLLVTLTETLRRAQSSGGRSAEVLDAVRERVEQAVDADGLDAAKRLLSAEIEHMTAENASLRRDLGQAERVVDTQRQLLQSWEHNGRVDLETQLPNKAAFVERLVEALARQLRHGEPFALGLFAIDDFETMAHTLGPEGTTRIVRGVAQRLRGGLRGTDFVARDLPSRFAVVFAHADPEWAGRQVERLQTQVELTRLNLDGRIVRVSFRVGCAPSRKGDTPQGILHRAELDLSSSRPSGLSITGGPTSASSKSTTPK